MSKHLSFGETLALISLLFGLFFGSGNLIFPVSMGQAAGRAMWPALAGFLVTAVGMPLLAVVALGISQCPGILELSGHVGRGFSYVYTCGLYLSLGPMFVVPRCITVPYEVGIVPLLSGTGGPVSLFIFSLCMFAALLWFSLHPRKILTTVGRMLNPMLLVMLGWLTCKAVMAPIGDFTTVEPQAAWVAGTFFTGLLEGYNTMDVAAALAFGIVIINALRGLGVTDPADIAKHTVTAGIFSCALMGLIYVALTNIGAESCALYPLAPNGGSALVGISRHYFTGFGTLFLAVTVLLACLKMAIGLIVSSAQTFDEMFPFMLSYKKWTMFFCVISFVLANMGLATIIKFSLPILLTLYPVSIYLVIVTLLKHGQAFSRRTMAVIMIFVCVGAVLDTLGMVPDICAAVHAQTLIAAAKRFIPLAGYGMAWIPLALLGGLAAALMPKRG